jgi:hypothetical protein
MQCCGFRSGIRCLFDPWIQELGSGTGKNQDLDPGSGSGMSNFIIYFRELKNKFFGLKYLNSVMRIRDGNKSDPGSEIYIPDQQHRS